MHTYPDEPELTLSTLRIGAELAAAACCPGWYVLASESKVTVNPKLEIPARTYHLGCATMAKYQRSISKVP